MTPTVAEPIREDEEATDPRLQLVPCDKCVHGVITTDRRGVQTKRRCRECKGNAGRVLAGNPPGCRYCLELEWL